ncbi:hypothetical protein G6F46_014695 [Rhizopus delemar]|nr:hypothetical protein G6F46_014695 [Rhizopus delemar]
MTVAVGGAAGREGHDQRDGLGGESGLRAGGQRQGGAGGGDHRSGAAHGRKSPGTGLRHRRVHPRAAAQRRASLAPGPGRAGFGHELKPAHAVPGSRRAAGVGARPVAAPTPRT